MRRCPQDPWDSGRRRCIHLIESLFEWPRAHARHREAPLLREREQYLAHLAQQGTSLQRIKTIAATLLQIIRVMELSSFRSVDAAEILSAGHRWAEDTEFHRTVGAGKGSGPHFARIATNWFRFHGQLVLPPDPVGQFDALAADFIFTLQITRGLSSATVIGYGWRIEKFLSWLSSRKDRISSVSIVDVDDYLDMLRAAGWRTSTIVAQCQALRTFFRHAAMRGWIPHDLSRGIRSPRVPKYHNAPKGPAWRDVRRLIRSTEGDNPNSIRLRPIVLLCSIYAFRSSEIVGLRLEDFDWRNETLTVRRAKSGRSQQYPIQYEAGEAILRYLREVRPRCSCRNLFVTRFAPYRPIRVTSIGAMVSKRMARLGVGGEQHGPHSLRHACATRLLRAGSSLQEIADFLGHKDTKCVRRLREI